MYFRILSHAGLLVRSGGVDLVCDPWLVGSCYWRSWWNFPEPDPAVYRGLRPQYVYLTHLHWDHFQADSLRLLGPDATLLIPKTVATRFRRDLRAVGCKKIIEIAHGETFELGADFRLTSYQAGLGVDSAAVIEDRHAKLLNLNDAKFFGGPLAALGRHGAFDFVLRSHANASGFPLCVRDYERFLEAPVDPDIHADEFALTCLATGARYAVPFASNHCFLHRETLAYNRFITDPAQAKRAFDDLAKRLGSTAQCTLMPPGSSWDSAAGFALETFDYTGRSAEIERMTRTHAPKLAAQYAKEDATRANPKVFERYFQRFFRAVPKFLWGGAVSPIVFVTKDADGEHRWALDLAAGAVDVGATAPLASPIEIHCHPLVLNDCAAKSMFSTWTASKRLTIDVASARHMRQVQRFFVLLDWYELDMLPIRRNFRAVALGIYRRRWREYLEYARLIVATRVLRRHRSLRDAFRSSLLRAARRQVGKGARALAGVPPDAAGSAS